MRLDQFDLPGREMGQSATLTSMCVRVVGWLPAWRLGPSDARRSGKGSMVARNFDYERAGAKAGRWKLSTTGILK